jgi:hypothetical protein
VLGGESLNAESGWSADGFVGPGGRRHAVVGDDPELFGIWSD